MKKLSYLSRAVLITNKLSFDKEGVIKRKSENGVHYKVAELNPTSDEFAADYCQLFTAAPDLLAALKTLTEHAQETYPHFESERGQRDIAAALSAISKAMEGK